MKNYPCLYVKGIFIDIIYALECKLNPCSNGILKYSEFGFEETHKAVLILVLMEYENT